MLKVHLHIVELYGMINLIIYMAVQLKSIKC